MGRGQSHVCERQPRSGSRGYGPWNPRVRILVLPLPSCVASSKFLVTLGLCFSICNTGMLVAAVLRSDK